MRKREIGIIGGAGYTGGEAIRILLNHPDVVVKWVQSTSNAGNLISDVHTDLIGDTNLRFIPEVGDADLVMMCMGHGDSHKWLMDNHLPDRTKIVDLSQDFRLASSARISNCSEPQMQTHECANVRKFVYGLPELNFERIKRADNIANPGCFATCIQLGLLPLASAELLAGDVNISATTGSTGAGQKPTTSTHFSWRAGNLSAYKPFEHQHLREIGESIHSLQPDWGGQIAFIPMRGAFTRGILATIHMDSDLTQEQAVELYREFYRTAAFTVVSDRPIDLKQVVNTNKCIVNVEKIGSKLLITSVIDNLLKGASGQAVQNMNLMLGLEETAGLKLKAVAF